MTVVIFGLAGCGKSTLAELLGARLGLRVIHPSGIMRDLLEQKPLNLGHTRANDGYWESAEGSRILSQRLDEPVPVDVQANEILLDEVAKGQVVIDSWALPWLTELGLRVHLRAELSTRARRAARRAGISYEQAREAIARKDEETRRLFVRLYGFDIMRDHRVFDFTLDTDELDAEEVLECVCEFLRTA